MADSSFAYDFVRSVGVRLDDRQVSSAKKKAVDASVEVQEEGSGTDERLGIELADQLDLAHVSRLPSRTTLLNSLESLSSQSALLRTASQDTDRKSAASDAAGAQAFLRLTYLAYAVSLDTLLKEAEVLGDQEWYWSSIEDELVQTCRYLLQTLPGRLYSLAESASRIVYDNARQTVQSASADSSAAGLRSLLDGKTFAEAWSLVRTSPTFVVAAMFPSTRQSEADGLSKQPKLNFSLLSPRAFSPLRLTRHEARHKRKRLSKERDDLAVRIGQLSIVMREQHAKVAGDELATAEACMGHAAHLASRLASTLVSDGEQGGSGPIDHLRAVLSGELPQHESSHLSQTLLRASPPGLGPPSTMARLWPTFVFVPTVGLVLLKAFARNKDAIRQSLLDARETVRGFLIGWVYEPAMRLLDTVRHGEAAEGVIISRESLNSDLKSLERMVTDFSRENYSMTDAELAQVAAKVKEGDLTHVLRVYETELKSPLKSAVTGSLIRTLLIQVQKAKVDLEVAMSGIDSLLKSQQLLFGAVGIAPAMGILYITLTWLRNKLSQASDRQGRAAGYDVKVRAWEALRRVDKLLAAPPASAAGDGSVTDAKTQGLLLLDLALLRSAAEPLVASAKASKSKGTRKKLRQQFLEDVRELEGSHSALVAEPGTPSASTTADVGLGWQSRRAVMDRIWRSWGPLVALQ